MTIAFFLIFKERLEILEKNVVYGFRKYGKRLCAVALVFVGLAMASQKVSADVWVANSPESIQIEKGASSYQLKNGDTIWAVSQVIDIDVDVLAQLSDVDLARGEQYTLPVGYLVKWNQEKSSVTLIDESGVVKKELKRTEDGTYKEVSFEKTTLSFEDLLERIERVEAKENISHVVVKDGYTPDEFLDDMKVVSVVETVKDVTKDVEKIGNFVEDQIKSRVVNTLVVNGLLLDGKLVSDGQKVVLNQVVDFADTKFQSFYVEGGKFYTLNDPAGDPVSVFDDKGLLINKIYKEPTGHNNDVQVSGNLKYIAPGGTKFYIWNTDNDEVSTVNLDTIAQYGRDNKTRIDIGGIAQSTTDDNMLYLVGLDKYETTAIERQKGLILLFLLMIKQQENRICFYVMSWIILVCCRERQNMMESCILHKIVEQIIITYLIILALL